MNKFKLAVKAIMQRNSPKSFLPKINKNNATLRLMDLYILKHLELPMTDEQLHSEYNRVKSRPKAKESTISRRRRALASAGMVVNTNTTITGPYKRGRSVWIAKEI
jgi:hypothetical protein